MPNLGYLNEGNLSENKYLRNVGLLLRIVIHTVQYFLK